MFLINIGHRRINVGTIGEAATIEFIGYCRTSISEKILKIIKDPDNAKLLIN